MAFGQTEKICNNLGSQRLLHSLKKIIPNFPLIKATKFFVLAAVTLGFLFSVNCDAISYSKRFKVAKRCFPADYREKKKANVGDGGMTRDFLQLICKSYGLKDTTQAEAELKNNLVQIREVVAKDFDGSVADYIEYLILQRYLEMQGAEFHRYLHTLERTKSVDKCLRSIVSLADIRRLSCMLGPFETTSLPYDHYLGLTYLNTTNYFLKRAGLVDYGVSDFALNKLGNKINARLSELSGEQKQLGESALKRITKNSQKGKFIDAADEVEKVFESAKPIPERSFSECLDCYVSSEGFFGAQEVQKQLRGESRVISQRGDGELTVNLKADTYRQLTDIINQINQKFQTSMLQEDLTIYKGIDQKAFLKLLNSSGAKISLQDFNVSNIFRLIDPERCGKKMIFEEKGFLSTSKKVDIAREFATRGGCVAANAFSSENVWGAIVELEAKKGTPAIDVNKELENGQFSREEEIILPRNTKFQVESVKLLKQRSYDNKRENSGRNLIFIKACIVQ